MMDKNSQAFSWKQWLAAEAVLAVALLIVMVLSGWYAGGRYGASGVAAAVLAFLICWLPDALSLLLIAILRDPETSLIGMLGGMLLRMGLPALCAVTVLQMGHWLVGVGLLPMMLVMYLIGLVVETALSVWLVGGSRVPVAKAW